MPTAPPGGRSPFQRFETHGLWAACAALLLALLGGCSCPEKPSASPAQPSPAPSPSTPHRPPEKLFGNDQDLVAAFSKVKACAFDGTTLDRGCPAVTHLQQVLEEFHREDNPRKRAVRTLIHLLQSRRVVTRLLAAQGLHRYGDDPKVSAAWKKALAKEPHPAVRAALLHEICWGPAAESEPLAVKLLAESDALPVQTEAAHCLARLPRLAPKTHQALLRALTSKAPAQLAGALCSTLATHRVAAALEVAQPFLLDATAGSRCAGLLGALGTPEALAAVEQAVTRGLAQGALPNGLVTALLSFRTQSFFRKKVAAELLEKIARSPEVDWTTRGAAIRGLVQGKETQRLARVAADLRKPPTSEQKQALINLVQAHRP